MATFSPYISPYVSYRGRVAASGRVCGHFLQLARTATRYRRVGSLLAMFFVIVFIQDHFSERTIVLVFRTGFSGSRAGRGPPPGATLWPDWMDDPAYLALRAGDEDPGDLGLDPEDAPPPEVGEGELRAEAAELMAAQGRVAAVMARLGLTAAMAADAAAALGRRGPGMPGSAESFPGVYVSRASGFASGMPLDTAAGCLVLGQFAEEAAGPDDRYPGACDDELGGVICAWDRVEAYASSRKHAAVAELIRRRPAEGCVPQGPAQMPQACDEFTARELGSVLGESRAAAEDMLSLAHELEVSLPGTKAAFRSGSWVSARPRSSPRRRRCWTPGRPGRLRRWCWAGRGR